MGLSLLDQSDILKGRDDAALQREMAQPSGGVPPFLVLSEISRRKDMRQRYAGEMARQAPKTTVAQDVLAAPSMPMPTPPGGISAAAQMNGASAPAMGGDMPGYASGGLVDAASSSDGYAPIIADYQSSLADAAAAQKREAALALLATGAGILSGGHSNFGQNLGAGINAGIGAFSKLSAADQTAKDNALQGLTNIETSQQADALRRLQMEQPPDAVRTFQFRQGLPPEQQTAFDDTVNPNAAFKRDQLQSEADQVAQIGDAKVNGTAPPTLTGLYHMAPKVQAYIAKNYPDFNLAQAQETYAATQRLMSTLNGPGQVRLKQAIDFTDQSIDKLGELADEWNGGQFPVLNKGNLMLALQGAKGPAAQSLAARLEAQRKEVISELATVYKGGNSPTDEGLKLAETQFDSAWSKGTFADAVKQAKQNILYRKNSLDQLAGGASANNPYMPDTTGAPVTSGDTHVAAPPPAAAAASDPETDALVNKWLAK